MDTLPAAAATIEQTPSRGNVLVLFAHDWFAPVISFAMRQGLCLNNLDFFTVHPRYSLTKLGKAMRAQHLQAADQAPRCRACNVQLGR